MDTRALRLLLDVERLGSFAAAARRHGVDPSSVSRAVAALEAELGFDLFVRTTRQHALTEAGAGYLRRIEPLLDDLDRASEEARGDVTDPRGDLRMLVPVSFGQLNVVPLLAAFLRQYPGIKVHLLMTDAILDLVAENIDLAVRLGPLADSSMIARRLAPMRARVCASPGYIAARGTPRHPAELAAHDCLLLDMPGFGATWRFRGPGGREEEVQVSGRLSTSNAVALKLAALDGAGVILQADWIVGREIADGSLVDLFPGHEATASTFDNAAWLLRPPRPYLPAKVAVMQSFLTDRFRDGAPWAREPEPGHP